MKTINRLVCLLLCVCILGCMVFPAFAEEENSEQSLTPYQDEYGYINEEELLGTDELVEYIPSRAADDYRAWAQADSRWGSILMGSSGITIASEGCLVTSITKLIIQSGLRDENSFNVGKFATWLNNHNGYIGNALYWDKPSECVSGFSNYGTLVSYGSYSSSSNNSQILGWISSGYHMTINVNNGGHWVAVDEAKSLATGQIYIMDSLSGVANADITLVSRYSTFNQIHAYKGGSTPQGNKPGKPSLKNFARSYAHGATTTFTWDSTVNTTHYNLYVDRRASDGTWERTYTWHYAESGFSYSFADGIYEVLLQSTNSNATGWPYTDGDWVTFVVGPHSHDKGSYMFYEAAHPHCNCYECSVCGTVWRDTSSSNYMDSCLECHRPDKPVITGVSSQYIEQQTITIRWTAGANTTHCNYWLQKKNGSGEWETKHKIDYASSPVTETLSAGEYRTFIVATNSNYWEEDGSTWLWIDSDYVYFSVKHKYVDTITPPTCTAQGYTAHTCSICGDSYKDSYTNALGHSYSYSATTAPTTSTTGVLTGTCTRCGATTTITLPKLTTTDYNYSVIQAATCIANGTGRYTWKTTTYGTFSFDVTIPKTGHSYTDTVTPPTCTVQGFTTHTCSVCGDSYVDAYISALGHDYQNGVCSRCGAKDSTTQNPFTDVAEGKYYYNPVMWAYYHNPQITAGTSETTFSPNDTCTRAQIVTFLWRAAGSPEPTTTNNPFKDVTSDKYYYRAVLWAAENGITSGTAADKFSPNDGCTRAQVVTFLWRFAGSPEPTTTTNPFTDVATGKYYTKAVLWAAEKGVTAGTSATTFSPDQTCTRGQIVTFLYRYIEG